MKMAKRIPEAGMTKSLSSTSLAMMALACFFFIGCSSGSEKKTEASASPVAAAEPVDNGKGIGPVTEVVLGALDAQLAETGKQLFESKCSACHRTDATRVVGPGIAGVTERRKPEWVMNMIINPEEMTKKDPTAKKLLGEYMTQMTNQNVDQDDARALLEYFRQIDLAQN